MTSKCNIKYINDKIKYIKFKMPNKKDKIIIKNNSWFKIYKFKCEKHVANNREIDEKNEIISENIKEVYVNKTVQIFPDNEQKQLFNSWFHAYRLMKNETIKYFKNKSFSNEKISTDFYETRQNLIDKKILLQDLIEYKIYAHSFDYAIKDICTNYKSAFTNKRNKHIKHFRIRYVKESKPVKIFKLEKTNVKVSGKNLINGYFGKIRCSEKLPKITCDFAIIYRNNRYFISIPTKTKCVANNITGNFLGIDAGIRTFLTCYNENEVIEICNNLRDVLEPLYNSINNLKSKIDNKEIKPNRGKKAINKRHRKIKNLITELHCKTINYLTKQADTLMLGNLSTKSIVSNVKGNISDLNKRLAMSMRLYEFRQKLKERCELTKKTFVEINEAYTTKVCSNCGFVKMEQNSSKTYKCQKCKICIGRDWNSARDIYLLGVK